MKTKIYISILFVFTLFGCTKYLDLNSPNDITVESFYKTEKDAFEATMAMYSNIQNLSYYGKDYFQITEYPSDDITTKFFFNALDAFSWSATQGASGTAEIARVFSYIYEGILRTNLVLEKVAENRIDKEPAIPFAVAEDRFNILAEAYFLRGLHYFNGACLFGGMSILTESPKDAKLGGILYTKRSSREETFNRAIKDLENAIGEGENIKIKLPTEWKKDFKGRATIFAGYALLGKIYLHAACYFKNQSYFEKSEKYLKLVIESGKFRLLPKYSDVFSSTNKHNAEGVFEIGNGLFGLNGFFHDGGIASENTQRDLIFGVQKGGAQGYGEMIATQNWLQECEYGDPRVREFLVFANDTIRGVAPNGTPSTIVYSKQMASTVLEVGEQTAGSYFHVKKAVDGYEAGGLGGVNGVNNWRLIRYADVLLMYAETLNELGRQTEAIGYINQIRKRARESVPVVNNIRQFRSAQIIRPLTLNAQIGDYTGTYAETLILNAKHKDDTTPILADFPCELYEYSGAPRDYTSTTKEVVTEMIVRERRVELAFEYLRFLDMRRWEAYNPDHPGTASKVFASKNSGNSITNGTDRQPYNVGVHSLFPIPQQQIDLSLGTLVQNVGY